MSTLGRFRKAAGETLSYSIDYSADLDTGDTLVASSAVASGADSALAVAAVIVIETGAVHVSKITLAGGTSGTTYTVTVTTTTHGGEVFVDTFTLAVK